MALDVAVHNAQVVHVQVYSGAVEGHLNSPAHRQVNRALHVQEIKEARVNELVNYDDVGDRRRAPHE